MIVLRYEDGDIRVMLVSNCGLVRIFALRFLIPEACTYGLSLCDDTGAWFIIDCLPYEWRSGTSDGLFLPIYPPRIMRVILGFLWLVDFCNKYVSSLWLMLNPWIIRTLTLPHFASLFGTVHCPYSPWVRVQTSPVHPNLVIWCALSHISHLISSPNSHHTYKLWHSHSNSRIYCHATSTVPFYHDTYHHCHIALHDHIVGIVFVAWPPFIFFIHVMLDHCTSWYTAGAYI